MTPDEEENGVVGAIPQFAPPEKRVEVKPEAASAPNAEAPQAEQAKESPSTGAAEPVRAVGSPEPAAPAATAVPAAPEAPAVKAAVVAEAASAQASTQASADMPVQNLKTLTPERQQALLALSDVMVQQARSGIEMSKDVKDILAAQAMKVGLTMDDVAGVARARLQEEAASAEAIESALQDLRALFASRAPAAAPRAEAPVASVRETASDPESKRASIMGAVSSLSEPESPPKMAAVPPPAAAIQGGGVAVPTGGAAAVSDKTAGAVGAALGAVGGAIKGVGVGIGKTIDGTVRGVDAVVSASADAAATAVKTTGSVLGKATEATAEATRDVAAGLGRGLFPGAGGRGVAVLPRLSEYRASQVEKSANAYLQSQEQFWQAGKMPALRKEIEERARVTGISVEDVMEKMRPNGEMADLHKKFTQAVAESPDAQASKKAMDKSLDSWIRQHGQAQKELLSPETHGNPHYDSLADRLEKAQGKMTEATRKIPAFENEPGHAEKLSEALKRIAERIKEMLNALVGRRKEATNDGPAP